ncbi:aldehyde ferredoxin oxidoreductase N-terminal domain-containing protein [Rhodospirillum rubrum]|uniref:Aldehyde ferredoxin oxidoreductase n=1 Tax=Rhodospirillum rubrum (strain ATCC 11170 / ATH 1.1.1 / DSM 467 / LMG 4362 / NCIMB 8255 / S1) TaxID=269796 RepID=Q2RXM7_RHORT|nr:aldehyde ferredoxin oxidoreductase N-terminal domain-containing protein [Rhodospirillum rubrum]ABC21118.1 Aldehyde ferredoxin oxidoreductase [Rhodospirillum rubrum ATCC 11170]AEO46786.1 aldehyde ferredoxin oxidoreductase [Rhodospirillum rubrum F11]MBK5952665.1 aldehyde:ferredoxin oxidoreductase [Rhodospirillum rubrum]QXG80810.1 aldehyde:ferredoxin oxidoreductase [Rhodospirillum rubrum]HAQ00280.1 aldehyde:ferredoxin oxidoreductase [Rhodospirillum rubrum]
MFGWCGHLLRVDLSTGAIRKEALEDGAAKAHLGAGALGLHLFGAANGETIDPFSGANRVVFVTGPLTGTLAPNSGQHAVVTAVPPQGRPAVASFASGFGPELKYAGYDAIVIEGRSAEPLYLWIKDDVVELRPAKGLWGETVIPTLRAVRAATHPEARFCGIGPAGENAVAGAVIVDDQGIGAGLDMGAVLGAKNLKGIAVRGTRGFRVADTHGFVEAALAARAQVIAAPLALSGDPIDDVMLVASAATTAAPAGRAPGRPMGCVGATLSFATFTARSGARQTMALNAEALPGARAARLGDYRFIVDHGLAYGPTRQGLAGLGDEDAALAVKAMAAGERPAFIAPPPNAEAAPPPRHGGYAVGGYLVVPDIAPSSDDPLPAVAEAAGLCPLTGFVCDADTLARLLRTATGIPATASTILSIGGHQNA